jgi:hypothetical protein
MCGISFTNATRDARSTFDFTPARGLRRDLQFGVSSGLTRHVWAAVEALPPSTCLYSKALIVGIACLDLACHTPRLQRPKSVSFCPKRWNRGGSQIWVELASDQRPFRAVRVVPIAGSALLAAPISGYIPILSRLKTSRARSRVFAPEESRSARDRRAWPLVCGAGADLLGV